MPSNGDVLLGDQGEMPVDARLQGIGGAKATIEKPRHGL
jgi:hypothetical protein